MSIEDLLIGVDSTITIPSSDPEIFLPSPDLSSDVTELLRLITESVPGARISDRPASLQIAFSGGISRWYFGDDFVDIAFSTEPEGWGVFVHNRRLGSTDVTIQLRTSVLSEVTIRSDDEGECAFDANDLEWVIPNQLARFSC